MDGHDVLWSTICYEINSHRLKKSCERTDPTPLLSDGIQEVVSHDLVVFAVAEGIPGNPRN
jgi:hypothetical protein